MNDIFSGDTLSDIFSKLESKGRTYTENGCMGFIQNKSEGYTFQEIHDIFLPFTSSFSVGILSSLLCPSTYRFILGMVPPNTYNTWRYKCAIVTKEYI